MTRTALATVLGLFLGLEREWSKKSAGIRTLALVTLLGAVRALVDRPGMLAVGGALVVLMGATLAAGSLLESGDEVGLFLTTWATLFVPGVAAGVGVTLVSMALVGVLVTLWLCDWSVSIDTELTSPFSLGNALKFGGLFLLVLVASAAAERLLGAVEFGSWTDPDIRRRVFQNVVITETNRGIGTRHRDAGIIENVPFADVVVERAFHA